MAHSDECLSESPKGFSTQRVAPEREGQLRGVRRFPTNAPYLLLSRCDSLICTFARDPGGGLYVKECAGVSFCSFFIDGYLADRVNCAVSSVVFPHANCF